MTDRARPAAKGNAHFTNPFLAGDWRSLDPHAVPLMPHEVPASLASRQAAACGETAQRFCVDIGVALQAVADGAPRAIA